MTIQEEFETRHFSDILKEDLEEFLKKKEEYIKNKSIDNSVAMKSAYEYVYTGIKSAWVSRKITEKDFWHLVDRLQEGL